MAELISPATTVEVSANLTAPATKPRTFTRKMIHWLLHSPVPIKAQVIGTIVIVGSIVQSFGLAPETAFSDKTNPINQYLVKLSWLWTLLWLVITVSITSALYSGLNWRAMLRHLARILISHIIWFSVTSLIVILDSYVGRCDEEAITDYRMCKKGGHTWTGFDISGHIFLLSYCIFVISEEAANIKLEVWNEYNGTLLMEHRVLAKNRNLKQWLENLHKVASYIVQPLELYGLALVSVWGVMATVTSLYFHTFVEKLIGYLLAVGAWYITYKRLYGNTWYGPCKPNYGLFHPIRHLTMNSPS